MGAAVLVGAAAVGWIGVGVKWLWNTLAKMHSAAAAAARKKGSWNVPETNALTVAPAVQLLGKVTVADPFMGMYMPKCPAINRIIASTATKLITEYSGFFHEKPSRCFA